MKHLRKLPVFDLAGACIGYECPEKGIRIEVCPKRVADAILVEHHYSHKVTQNSFVSLVVLYRGVPSGALQCGYGIRPKLKTRHVGGADGVREFDRMWLSDEMPKYSETIVLSLFHRFMRRAYPDVRVLISYADTSAGNTGTIYRAANYKLDAALKADFYVLPSGERVHPVTMWHRHGTRKMEILQKIYPGICKADGKQLRFIYELK